MNTKIVCILDLFFFPIIFSFIYYSFLDDILEDLTRGEIARILKVALKENPDKIKLMKCLKYTDEKDKKMADEEVNMLKLAES